MIRHAIEMVTWWQLLLAGVAAAMLVVWAVDGIDARRARARDRFARQFGGRR